VPYTAAVDEKTSLLTPARSIAVNNEIEPLTLLVKYNSGFWVDSPTAIYAAK
jgi:hypothetical protein